MRWHDAFDYIGPLVPLLEHNNQWHVSLGAHKPNKQSNTDYAADSIAIAIAIACNAYKSTNKLCIVYTILNVDDIFNL